mmetsp:Transcript_15923/g.24796  ORF Transcript_15923/g.24796 Transcript_15923/m.24796 type:complete len:320 (+) Transcript_15923:78-1037(+)|eukprot:CAMPEP_0184318952 /NCGR_PEP_ID=MMETSP1049-20130417/105744_1 /TAXON_ID=77928 /ORGANISM="Proteomonas sulcata, Strain CCMP704" /LENGTH=319 /DNA_ID=CAMNT_0026638929 /DNA_START=65 /DNA_END=1024 /DNA_ORIENTATION=+
MNSERRMRDVWGPVAVPMVGLGAVFCLLLVTPLGLKGTQPNAAPVELEGLSALRAHMVHRHPNSKLAEVAPGWKPQGKNSMPKDFLDSAERVRLETAIRLAADKLEKQQDEKALLEKQQELAESNSKKAKAEAQVLQAKVQDLADKAVGEKTTSDVEHNKGETTHKEEKIEKRIASLMAEKTHDFEEKSERQAALAEEGRQEAGQLKAKITELDEDARSKGKHADAVVTTAKQLLASAKRMSAQAETMVQAPPATKKSLLERLHDHKKMAEAHYDADMKILAKAQLKLKKMTGVEGVDEISRAQEHSRDVKEKIDLDEH